MIKSHANRDPTGSAIMACAYVGRTVAMLHHRDYFNDYMLVPGANYFRANKLPYMIYCLNVKGSDPTGNGMHKCYRWWWGIDRRLLVDKEISDNVVKITEVTTDNNSSQKQFNSYYYAGIFALIVMLVYLFKV